MEFINKNHLPSAIWGLVTADALGVPYEFKRRDSFKVSEMIGYGTHNQPVGYWSDDSSMMLATLCSFIEKSEIDYTDIMTRFLEWRNDGEYSPGGICFDIGMAVNRALDRFEMGYAPLKCGGKKTYDNGNGSLMRILPIAFVPHTFRNVAELSAITHANEISVMGCRHYIQFAESLMQGMSKEAALASLSECSDEYENLKSISSLPRARISSSGYIVDSLKAAIWCFMNTESYRDCVITAVELGDDTDTVAAIAGGIAGIYYGIGGEYGIPEEWISLLAKREWIAELISNATQ